MLAEYPENDALFIGAERLGRLVGRSGRWVRERETEGVIERAVLNGESARERPVYDADQTLPKLVAFLAARKGPSPEQQALAAQRVEAGRLKLEAARLELGRLESKLIETEAARRVFGELVVYFRQRLMYLPGALKNKLRLDLGQTLAIQKEIRAALTELRDQGKRAAGGEAPTGKPAPQRRQRSKESRRVRIRGMHNN
jgi:hypothetical protein